MSNIWAISHRYGSLLPLQEALDLQERLFERRMGGDTPNFMILAEHEPVYTCNRQDLKDLAKLFRTTHLPAKLVALSKRRGGSITYHGPGQLVCYLIIRLEDFGLGPMPLIAAIDEAIIKTVSKFGIKGRTKPARLPVAAGGVWVEKGGQNPRKLASRGLRISRGITRFGFALNVNTDLSYFDAVYPCGLDIEMTSIERETGQKQSMADVAYTLQEAVMSSFGRFSKISKKAS